MGKSLIFSDSANTEDDGDILFGRSSEGSLGGNLHDLSNTQIAKLIYLKFDGDPIPLIRQLSADSTLKERELVLLRRDTFAREKLLVKLLSSHGNMSSLEIDQKLSTLHIDRDVDKALTTMITGAMNDPISLPQSETGDPQPSKAAPRQSLDLTSLRSLPAINAVHDKQSSANRSSTWLSHFFNHSETGSSHLPTGRPHSKSFPLKVPFTFHGSHSTDNVTTLATQETKVPVELEAIRSDLYSLPQVSVNVDKFGFLNDIGNVWEHKIEAKPEPQQVPSSMLEPASSIAISALTSLVQMSELEVTGTLFAPNHTPSVDALKQLSKMHDEKNKQYEDEWDAFFRALQREYYRHTSASKRPSQQAKEATDLETQQNIAYNTMYSAANEMFGLRGLNLIKFDKSLGKSLGAGATSIRPHGSSSGSGNGSSGGASGSGGERSGGRGGNGINHQDSVGADSVYFRKLHKLIAKNGIPTQHRSQLWLELSGAKNLKVAGEFDRLYNLAIDNNDPLVESNINQVKLDLHRTMPSNVYFNDVVNLQPGPNYYRLQKILYAFVVYKPHIGYCQGMNKIISNLLLGVNGTNLDEADIFWIFASFIDELLPQYGDHYNFFDNKSLSYIGANQQVLAEVMLPKLLPILSRHLSHLGVQVEYITLNWWILLFTENCLPIEIWIKWFDNLLVSSNLELEFFSMSLALFKNFERLILTMDSADDVYLVMKNLNQNKATKSNLKYSELMLISRDCERKINTMEINRVRGTIR